MAQVEADLSATVPHMEYRGSKRKYSGTYQKSYPGATRKLIVVLLFLWGLRAAGFTYDSGVRRTMYLQLSWGVSAGEGEVTIVIFVLAAVVLLAIVNNNHISAGIHITYIFFILMAMVVITGIATQQLKTTKYILAQGAIVLVYTNVMLICVLAHYVLARLMPALHRRNSRLTRPVVWPRGKHDMDMPAMARWEKVLSGPIGQQTLNRQNPLQTLFPSCISKPGLVGYKGQVDEEGRPHGLGEWNTGEWNGEHYQGLWHHGIPIAPFKSREVGSSSSFVGHRIAFVQCRPETNPWTANILPSNGSKMMWGIGSVETSASGVFFLNYPFVQLMSKAEFLGTEYSADSNEAGPFEVPGISFDDRWTHSVFDDYDEAFGIRKGAGSEDLEEGSLEPPVRDTTWMRDLLLGLSPPEAVMMDPDTSWREAGDVDVYVNGVGLVEVSGHVHESAVASPTKRINTKKITIRLVRRDLKQDSLMAVASEALAVVSRPHNISNRGSDFPASFSPSNGNAELDAQDDQNAADQDGWVSSKERELQAALGSNANGATLSNHSAMCLKVEGWIPRNRVGAYEAIIFVHGYNAWPVNSLEKVGQLLALGNFPDYIKPIIFAWPGGGHPLIYPGARHTCKSQQVVSAFMELLRALQAERVNNVHILGHSMGARVVMAVAPAMLHGYRKGYLTALCQSITLLQPEYALKPFCEEDVAIMRSFCPIITVYGNGKDGALGPAEYMAPLLDTVERKLPAWLVQPGARADRLYAKQHASPHKAPSRSFKPVGAATLNHHAYNQEPHLLNQQYETGHVSGTSTSSIQLGLLRNPPDTWYYEKMLGRAVDVGLVVDPVTKKFLDVDIINTTYVQANVHDLRHTFFHLNREIVADLRDIIVSKRRARQRTRLELIGGNVYGFLVAPTYVLNP